MRVPRVQYDLGGKVVVAQLLENNKFMRIRLCACMRDALQVLPEICSTSVVSETAASLEHAT